MQSPNAAKDPRGSAIVRVAGAARRRLATVEVGQGDHVGWERIEDPGVGSALGADVDQGESKVWEALDQIVDPRRDASLHVRVGPLEHEANIRAPVAAGGILAWRTVPDVKRLHAGCPREGASWPPVRRALQFRPAPALRRGPRSGRGPSPPDAITRSPRDPFVARAGTARRAALPRRRTPGRPNSRARRRGSGSRPR